MTDKKKTLAQTRAEHDAKWLGAVDEIRAGDRLGALVSGAKAYLGQYLNLQETVEPRQRVGQIFNPVLAEAVQEGLVAALTARRPPSPVAIARAQLATEDQPLGYVFLAGADLLARTGSGAALERLPTATRRALLCYALAVPTDHVHHWFPGLLDADPQLAAAALWAYWQPFIGAGERQLPGLQVLLAGDRHPALARRLILPVLEHHQAGDWRSLRDLLAEALCLAAGDRLLGLARREAARTARAPRERVHWLAAGFLLAPEEFGAALSEFCGQSKEKILPLLDFVAPASGPAGRLTGALPVAALARLLRIIGPVFPPAVPVAGPDTDRISVKVLELFEAFGRCRGPEAESAYAALRAVRVMRRCAAALERHRPRT